MHYSKVFKAPFIRFMLFHTHFVCDLLPHLYLLYFACATLFTFISSVKNLHLIASLILPDAEVKVMELTNEKTGVGKYSISLEGLYCVFRKSYTHEEGTENG